MKFKRVDTSSGRAMYFANGKLTSVGKLPTGVAESLTEPGEITITEPKSKTECLVPDCADVPSRQKFLSGEIVDLCATHYLSMSTGKLAQIVRENLNQGISRE